MAYFPMSGVAKTLCLQASQTAMRTTGLGISAVGETLITQTTQALMRTTGLGFSAFMETIFDDADGPAVRATIGAGVGYTAQAKSANFTAADGFAYGIDASGGAIAVTLPACSAGLKIAFKVAAIGNATTITRAGADTVDGGTNVVLSASAKEAIELWADASGTNWEVH